MAEENTSVQSMEPTAGEQEKTFTQADVDTMIQKRLERERKKYPDEEELTAFRAWKESQQSEQERWDALTRERDESRTALTAAQAELEQYRREKLLLSKGVRPEDADYYAFKIGKLVTDDTDFETAAAQYLKEHVPQAPEKPAGTIRVDFGGPLGGSGSPRLSMNEFINNKLRGR